MIAFDLENTKLPIMPISMVALSLDIMIVNSGAKGMCSACKYAFLVAIESSL